MMAVSVNVPAQLVMRGWLMALWGRRLVSRMPIFAALVLLYSGLPWRGARFVSLDVYRRFMVFVRFAGGMGWCCAGGSTEQEEAGE